MEDQENIAPSAWRRELRRTLLYGTANVVLSGISEGRLSLLAKASRPRLPIPASPKQAPLPVSRPAAKKHREPDLLEQVCLCYGIGRWPPRRR